MKRFAIASLIYVSTALCAKGQGSSPRLHIGDTMPEMTFHMLGYKDTLLHTADLTKKLTILSFWTPICSVSSGQLPVLNRLQEEFPDDLQIVTVGFNGREEGTVQKFLADSTSTAKGLHLPVALQPAHNPTLYPMLPFMGLPQNVWLNDKHVILAITDQFALTPARIQRAIRGEVMSLELKDFDTTYSTSKPLLVNGNGGADSEFIYRSLITPYKPLLSMGEIQERTDRYTRVAAGNATPVLLLLDAASGSDSTHRLPGYDPMNKRLLNLVTGNDLFGTAYYELPMEEGEKAEALRKRQLFSYELMMPPSFSYPSAYHKMLTDLCDYFGVKAGIETQPVTCLLVVKKGLLKKENPSNEEEN
ncbi:MAG: hypothetical protein INR69_18070, partial [Mucilaginibacter polytrichastri]|nr:hypothetical protein [Mucilaginibacter polytrichastri]